MGGGRDFPRVVRFNLPLTNGKVCRKPFVAEKVSINGKEIPNYGGISVYAKANILNFTANETQ